MGSGNEIMEYRTKKIKKFMEIEEEEDDELFFIIVPALLEGLNEEKRPVHTSEYTGAKKMREILAGHESWCRKEPRLAPPSPTEHDNLDDPSVGVNPFASNLEEQGLSNDPINLDEVEHTTSSCSEQNGAGNGKKRKRSQVVGVLQEYVDYRKKQTRIFENELNATTKPNDNYSIKNCLAVLESIEKLSDAEKAKATRIFKCEQNREIFLNIKNPNVRLLWIQDEIAP